MLLILLSTLAGVIIGFALATETRVCPRVELGYNCRKGKNSEHPCECERGL